MPPPEFHAVAAVFSIVSMALAFPAWGQTASVIRPQVIYTVQYDDNVLGLPSPEVAESVTGNTRTSDVTRSVRLGLQLEKTFGRQRVSADVGVSDVKFDRYAQLNYQERVLNGTWDWQVGNYLNGKATTCYVRGLMPFDDYHLPIRRLQAERIDQFEMRWRLHSRWQLRAEIGRYEVAYDGNTQPSGNRTEIAGALGGDYITPSGNLMGIVARRMTGKYGVPLSLATSLFRNDFEQNEIRARVDWRPNGKTRLQFSGGTVSRKYDLLRANNFKGGNGRVDVNWAASGKTSVTTSLWRELGIVDDLAVYSINRGASIGPAWEVTSKVQTTLRWRFESRAFRMPQGRQQIAAGDTRRSIAWSTDYLPDAHWLVQASLVHFTKVDEGTPTGYLRRTVNLTLKYLF